MVAPDAWDVISESLLFLDTLALMDTPVGLSQLNPLSSFDPIYVLPAFHTHKAVVAPLVGLPQLTPLASTAL